ncbi:MAG: hypothetical protein WC100_11940 [Sterolibacterium sp.]
MAINAVSTSAGAATQLTRSQQQPNQAQPVAQAKHAQPKEAAAPTQQPQPVVNAQGQMIGQRINTKA